MMILVLKMMIFALKMMSFALRMVEFLYLKWWILKLVLPALLKSIDESDAWRTKQGAIDVLGAMAHCAPRQLSQCLPTVVPRLCETLQDTHPKVKAASKASLNRIGDVIRNPEIKEISEDLLNALADASYTSKALQRLMDMAFVHAVDAPSLAIIMPILQKSLKDRSTETKKSGCQIVGSMCSLIGDAKDMEPYLPMVLPELQVSHFLIYQAPACFTDPRYNPYLLCRRC